MISGTDRYKTDGIICFLSIIPRTRVPPSTSARTLASVTWTAPKVRGRFGSIPSRLVILLRRIRLSQRLIRRIAEAAILQTMFGREFPLKDELVRALTTDLSVSA